MLGFAALSAAVRGLGLDVPVLRVPFLAGSGFGWMLLVILGLGGAALGWRGRRAWRLNPLTQKKIQRFRSIPRGVWSLRILAILSLLACFDSLLVGKRALVVRHEGQWHFPFIQPLIPGTIFGGESEEEADYRELKDRWAATDSDSWLILPPVPFDAKLDSPDTILTLVEQDEAVFLPDAKTPFNGRAYTVFADKPEQKRREWTYRNGERHGEMRGWNPEGDQIERDTFDHGKSTDYTDYIEGGAAAFEGQGGEQLLSLVYPPTPPSWSTRHYLGTNTSGIDVLASLYGGWQQALIASILFLVFVFAVSIAVGGSLGYFAGIVDMVGLRIVEIWSVLPFLFVVIIISSIVQPNLLLLIAIIALFGWMGTTTYLRTATYKEKERDYVAAARLLGAGPARIISRHILPNTIAILVTLAPFLVATIISSLAALDFLGFGLPPEEPSWGRLMREGTDNTNYPWILVSAFSALTVVLILVTFIGEAVREAFDPKKFTTYE